MENLLVALGDCRGAIEEHDRHPWRGCRPAADSLARGDDVAHHLGRLAGGLGVVAAALPKLAQLGFVPESATLDDWSRGLDEAREARDYPLVAAAWFAGEPRRAASAHVDLDRASRDYREARDGLPEFSEAAARSLDPAAFDAFARAGEVPPARLAAPPAATVRDRRAEFVAIAAGLATLADAAEALRDGLRATFRALGAPDRPLAVEWFPGLVERLRLAARLVPVPRDWLDPGRRGELRQVVERCRDAAAANAAARASLLARLSPRAFDPESAPLVARAASFAPFWMRLLPGWWSYRSAAGSLYIQGRPDPATLLRDMGELAGYRRREDYARDVRDRYAVGLARDAAGSPTGGRPWRGSPRPRSSTSSSSSPPSWARPWAAGGPIPGPWPTASPR